MSLRITTDMDPERVLFADTNIPKRYRGLRVADVADPATDHGSAMAGWLKNLPEQQRTDALGVPLQPRTFGRGLLLAGAPGTGKTTAAAALACEVRRAKRSVYFIRWPEYVDRARASQGDLEQDPATASRIFHSMGRVDEAFLVVLDDIGHEHFTASRYAEDLLGQVIRAHHEAGRPTIGTTNLGGVDWKNRYTPALRSFMSEATLLVPFFNDDLRGA